MHDRLLLGGTALVSAGILLANAAPARAEIEVTLGGYTEFGAAGATDDTLQDDPDRGYTFFMDNEVHIEAIGVTDGGLTYGSYIEIEIGSGDSPGLQASGGPSFISGGSGGNVYVDEVNLFFSGGFGRIEAGRQDGAEDEMFVGAEDAQSGTGGIDGDTANLGSIINLQNSDHATKVTYYSPRVAGFQLGASYTPSSDDDGGRDAPPFDEGFENLVGGGVNWIGEFGGVELELSAVGIYGKSEDPGPPIGDDDLKDYTIGGLVGVGGLSFGATWGQLTDFNQGQWASLGLQYSFGDASASVGYSWVDQDDLEDDQNIVVASGDIGLAPGLTLKGDVSYNTEDPGNDDSDGANQDGTVAGVITIQLDY